jgi:hypothetical protein
MRAAAVEITIKVPGHGIGFEVGAVVEFHAMAQMEDPGLVILRIALPFFREPGTQTRQLVGLGQIPQHQTLEDRIAEEAHAFKTVVGQPGRGRNI